MLSVLPPAAGTGSLRAPGDRLGTGPGAEFGEGPEGGQGSRQGWQAEASARRDGEGTRGDGHGGLGEAEPLCVVTGPNPSMLFALQMEKCAQDLGNSTKAVTSAIAHLLGEVAQGNENYTGTSPRPLARLQHVARPSLTDYSPLWQALLPGRWPRPCAHSARLPVVWRPTARTLRCRLPCWSALAT